MRSSRAQLHILLAALVALLVAVVSDRAHYFCKMADRAVEECCCPAEHEHQSGPVARAPDCCEPLALLGRTLAVLPNDAAPSAPHVAVAALLPMPELPVPSFELLASTPAAARAPPAIGPPLFLAHCALLI